MYPSLCLPPSCTYEVWKKVVTAEGQVSEEWVMCKKLCVASSWRLLVFETPKKSCLHPPCCQFLCIPKVCSSLQTGMLIHLLLPEAPFFLLGLGEQVTE